MSTIENWKKVKLHHNLMKKQLNFSNSESCSKTSKYLSFQKNIQKNFIKNNLEQFSKIQIIF